MCFLLNQLQLAPFLAAEDDLYEQVGKKAPVKEKGQKTKPINKGKGKVGEESSTEEANQQGAFADLDVEALMKRIDEKLDAHTVEIKQLYAADLKLMRDQLQDEIVSILRSGGKFPSPKATEKSDSTPISKDPPTKAGATGDADGGGDNSDWPNYPGVHSILQNINEEGLDRQNDLSKQKGQFGRAKLVHKNVTTADGGHNMEVADRFVLLSEDDVAESEEEDDSGLNDNKIIDEDKEASTMEQARAEVH
ncbi:hypothetical protein AALP_AAs53617U000100 [Arabis alpina]|uniref:Uncharacterized protein n=1 Tax=Arabis alpina TaxID=50452 RepID=A0A087G0V0_ARAAL|nr:hypothetical protein AALP_AAs53617U000100 [Arabis alpina]